MKFYLKKGGGGVEKSLFFVDDKNSFSHSIDQSTKEKNSSKVFISSLITGFNLKMQKQ